MRKILSLLGFCVLAFHGFGQVKKIEKRSYGLLDSVYYVNGGDTVCVEGFHKNGLLKIRAWKNDSNEVFNTQGKKISYTQSHIKHSFGYNPRKFDWWGIHNEKKFYPDGKLRKEISWQGDSANIFTEYEPNGEVLESEMYHKYKAPNGEYHIFYHTSYEKGKKVKVTKHDTLLHTATDSFFIQNKLSEVKYYSLKTDIFLEYWSYDDNEKMDYHWVVDSNRLHADKDNGDCVYGFRNLKGDWVIKPQYDNAILFNKNYFLVNKNEKYGIIDDFGKSVLPLEYDFLGVLIEPDSYDENFEYSKRIVTKPQKSVTLKYRIGEKYGVLDYKGQILLPPQYDNVHYMKGDTFEVKVGNKKGLVNSKGRVIVQPKYLSINFTSLPNIFQIIDTITSYENGYSNETEIRGLLNDKGEVILSINFTKMEQSKIDSNIFYVKSLNRSKKEDSFGFDGIFDLKKGWILDTTFNHKDHNIYEYIKKHPTLKDSILERGKYGFLNDKLDIKLPFEYDNIEVVEKKTYNAAKCINGETQTCHDLKLFFICQKDKKYGIYDPLNDKWLIPLKYDHITKFIINHSTDADYASIENAYENDIQFLALKDGKWRWIDENDKQLSDNLIQYAGILPINSDAHFIIKDNKVTIFDEDYFPQHLPFQKYLDDNNRSDYDYDEKHNSLTLIKDFEKGLLLVNQKGLVIVPPQYFVISNNGKHAIVKDDMGKQWSFDDEGNKRPFLQDYKIHLAQIEAGLVIVEDTIKQTFGIISPEGKTILPIKYYSVSELDSSGIIWAKEREPSAILEKKEKHKSILEMYKSTREYTLNSIDSGWLMYNKKGKLLTKTAFAFPFKINCNHGIGVLRMSVDRKQYKAGIWRTTDGTNLLPPQYDHIFFDEYNRLYLIYKKSDAGIKVGVCDTTGRILIEPKFDRMGVFNGNYALVQEGGKMGLIMRNGQLKIPPQYNAFKTTSENIEKLLMAYRDSVKKANSRSYYRNNGFSNDIFRPRDFYRNYISPIDTIDIERSRIIKNLVIEKIAEGEFIDGEYIPLYRSDNKQFCKEYSIPLFYGGRLGLTSTVFNLAGFNNHERSIGFILGDSENRMPRSCGNRGYDYKAYNYLKNENGEWDEVTINDLLNLNPDNRFKINQLIIEKIRNLKDANIDCADSGSYFEQNKDKFYVYPEGLNFFLSRSWFYNYPDSNNIEILLTWDELKPYLKKKE
jgi:WG containing repeat